MTVSVVVPMKVQNDSLSGSPLVSILICNYNYGRFIREAIDSALGQTYSHTEVIVVDDGSTDDSRAIIAKYGNSIIPVIKDNGGHSSAVNAGFAASRGDVVCLLDSDDVFSPDKISLVLKAWRKNPDSCVVYHQLQMIDAHGKTLGRPWPRAVWQGNIREKVERSGGWWPHPTTSGLSFLRSFMERILPIPTAPHRLFPDTHLAGPAAFLGSVSGVPLPLAFCRRHDQNTWAADHVDRRIASQGRIDVSGRRLNQYAVEFEALNEILRTRMDVPPPISLDDFLPYQWYRRAAGQPVSLSSVIATAIRCRTLPPSMKWRELVKMVLNTYR